MAEMLGKSWGLDTPDLLQQIALLAWLNNGDEGKDMMKLLTQGRVVYELYNRVSGQRQVEQYEQECILGIVDYIKKNPKHSQDALAKEVEKHVALFKARIEDL